MFVKKIIFAVAATSLLFGGITARAQDNGALLDLLVRKKIITDQEAEELRGELTKDYSQTPAGKLRAFDSSHRIGTLRRCAGALRNPEWQ